MVVPVTQEQAGIAVVFLCSFNDPVHERQAVLVVQQAVGLQSKMDIGERYRSLE